MSGSTPTTVIVNEKAGDDLPKANSNVRDCNRDDNTTSSSPVDNGRTNDSRNGQGGWRNNDNSDNKGIIAGDNSTNLLNSGQHSAANMLGNTSYVTLTDSTLNNVSGVLSNLSINLGPRNAATNKETGWKSNQAPDPTAGNNDTGGGTNDVGGRHNFPGPGRKLTEDTITSGETKESDNGPYGRSNTGDWSGNKNTNNTGIIAGNGSKNTVNNGPSITANMFEGASGITLNGGTYNNVAGGNDGHPKKTRTI